MESEEFEQTGLTLLVAKRTLEGASETGLPERGGKWTHSYDRRIKSLSLLALFSWLLGFRLSHTHLHIYHEACEAAFFGMYHRTDGIKAALISKGAN